MPLGKHFESQDISPRTNRDAPVLRPDDIQLPGVDILVANILLNPLQELASLFSELVQPSGDLVLSGLLPTQAEECLEAYQSWFNMDVPVFKQEWSLLHGTRRTAPK